jgi:excinuclease ABC subunit B
MKEEYVPVKEIPTMVEKLKKEMKEAASRLEFEQAAEIRDRIHRLEEMELKMR